MNQPVRVYAVASSEPQRRALERLVGAAPGLSNLGSGNLNRPAPRQADVVLAEVLPGEAPAALSEGPPYWLALLDDPQASWVQRSLGRNLRGVLPRRSSESEIEAALTAVAQGLVVSHPEHQSRPQATPLSQREQEVLECLALGRSNRDIAVDLNISEHTVKFHLNSIFQKLNASNRSEAVSRGLRQGLVRV